MKLENVACTGCSLLCDDVDVEVEGGAVLKTWGACSHGTARLKELAKNRLAAPLLKGSPTSVEEAVEALAESLKSSRNPAVYGGENSSNEAVELLLRLAEKLGAVYDAPASICRELLPLQEGLGLETSSFDSVLNDADLIMYFGVSVADTHLRHASRYAVMPRGSTIKMGRENRVVAVLDVFESMSMKIAQHKLVVDPYRFADALKAMEVAIQGSAPAAPPQLARQIALLASDVRAASFAAVFAGSRLLRGGDAGGAVKALAGLARALAQRCRCSLNPLAETINAYGQAAAMLRALRTCKPYSFRERKPSEPLHILALRGNVDLVLSVNSDLVAQLPPSSALKLKGKLACTTELMSLTHRASSVAVPVKALGVEAGGTVTRTDGVNVEVKPVVEGPRGLLSEEEVLSRLIHLI